MQIAHYALIVPVFVVVFKSIRHFLFRLTFTRSWLNIDCRLYLLDKTHGHVCFLVGAVPLTEKVSIKDVIPYFRVQ